MDLHALTPAQRRLLAAVVLIGALAVFGLPRLVHGGQHVVVPALHAPRPARAAPTGLVVDVAGAVRRPGLYRLAQGTRIADAVRLAGGATAKADINLVNLAAPLDLNTASLEQLDALPGIGPTTAQKILDYRQAHGAFHSFEELDAVPGIGPSRIAQLKGLVIP